MDGIHQVISVLEKIEMGELKNVVYCEAQACVGGVLEEYWQCRILSLLR